MKTKVGSVSIHSLVGNFNFINDFYKVEHLLVSLGSRQVGVMKI